VCERLISTSIQRVCKYALLCICLCVRWLMGGFRSSFARVCTIDYFRGLMMTFVIIILVMQK